VVARYAWHASGRGPDAVMEMSMVLTFRKGKVITVQDFWDHAEALEAAGVRE
jgi:ketosteroid isomerase-like protein